MCLENTNDHMYFFKKNAMLKNSRTNEGDNCMAEGVLSTLTIKTEISLKILNLV